MEAFELTLGDGTLLTGRHIIPTGQNSSVEHRPLIVALHGGSYDSQYFDADHKRTARISSKAYGVPFVAIDRPCYGGTTSIVPLPEHSSFPQQTARVLHEQALPALWKQYGAPNNCNSIVLLCHSLGVMPGVILAAMHAKDTEAAYPLSGLILSGLGSVRHPEAIASDSRPRSNVFDPAAKDAVMFRPGTVDPEVLQHTERLHAAITQEEVLSMTKDWLPRWKEGWAPQVEVPVPFSLSEQDRLFVVDEEQMAICTSAFQRSSHVESVLMKKAPHCLELSYWSQAWYARCFGFAMQCACSVAIPMQ